MMIEYADRLTSIFGTWPSFHDAEVLSILLDRAGDEGPVCVARVYLFERTAEVDSDGYYVLQHHTIVTLRFTGIVLEGMAWFNGQNVIEDLVITELDPGLNEGRCWRVEFVSCYGVGATLECRGAVVEKVERRQPIM